MKNRLICKLTATGLLAAALMAASIPAVSAADYVVSPVRTYSGQFADVAQNAWYYNDVSNAYSLGLIDGKSDSVFDPNGTLTIAQTVKLAAVCHQLCSTGAVDNSAFASTGSAWYDGYIAYGKTYGIVTEDTDYNAPATRGQVAVFFSRAIMSAGLNLTEKNTIATGSLKDVDTSRWYANAVYRLYRWGIMTGDENGNINPDKEIKRSEIAAIVMRMVNSADRVAAVQNPTTNPTSDPKKGVNSLTLYEGSTAAKDSTMLDGFAADLGISDGKPFPNGTMNLTLVNHLVLEKDNISFRLYEGAGYEPLANVRASLNGVARGVNGKAQRGAGETYDALNKMAYLWIGGTRYPITELWYADHDTYTTYALYFGREIDLSTVNDIKLICGSVTASELSSAGLTDLSNLLTNAGAPAALSEIIAPSGSNQSAYEAALNKVTSGAISILFQSYTDRAAILYGQGLDGSGAGDYRLMLVFKDGTTQVIVNQVLNAIRMNNAGDIVYYAITGPDGQDLQYAVNLNN